MGQTAMLMAASNDLSVVVKALIMGNADVNQVGSWDSLLGKLTRTKLEISAASI